MHFLVVKAKDLNRCTVDNLVNTVIIRVLQDHRLLTSILPLYNSQNPSMFEAG